MIFKTPDNKGQCFLKQGEPEGCPAYCFEKSFQTSAQGEETRPKVARLLSYGDHAEGIGRPGSQSSIEQRATQREKGPLICIRSPLNIRQVMISVCVQGK